MVRKENLKKLIVKYERRLQKLREYHATRGMDTPPHILTEIEDIEAKIEELQTELKILEDKGNREEISLSTL